MRNNATYLRARVDGQERDCLLDSGSEVSLLPTSVVRHELIRPTTSTLRTATGTGINVLGEATVPFSTPYVELQPLVSDHVAEVVLGVKCLSENNASWDFRQATFRLGRHYRNLKCRRGPISGTEE